MIKHLIVFIGLLSFTFQTFAQDIVVANPDENVKYEVVFNSVTCRYEARLHIIKPLPSNHNIVGTSGFSIVIPASYPDGEITDVISVNPSGLIWNDNTPIYAPESATSSDFHKFFTNTAGKPFNSGTNLNADEVITLFTFALPASNCADGIRLFVNWEWNPTQPSSTDPHSTTDPSYLAAGMGGSDFRNSFQISLPITDPTNTELYIGNQGTPTTFPTYTAGITTTVNGSNIDLAATVTGLSSCMSSTMSYKWYDYTNALLGTTSTLTNKPIGFYKVVTTNNYGCTAEATTDYEVCAWRSTTNGSWSDYTTWEALLCDGGWVNTPTPPNNDRPIFVYHTVSIPASTPISADSLYIKPTGIVSVPATSTLTVTDQLIIGIDQNGIAGQLNSNGDCDNIVTTAAKIIVRKALDNTWDFISFPFEVTSVLIAGTETPANWGDISPSTVNADFYAAQYDGAARASSGNPSATIGNYWINVTDKTFVPVRGYIVSGGNRGADSLDFVAPTGTQLVLCNGSYAPENYTPAPACNGGWCLVGTPYVSAYDLYYASPYKSYYIAPNYTPVTDGQNVTLNAFGAFFMQATAADPVTYPVTGLPQGAPRQTPKYNNLELAINNAVRSNNTLVRLAEDANVNYQLGEDAMNFNINSSSPQIYSEAEGACTGLAVNTLPLNTERVDLKVRIASLGAYTIKLNNIDILNNIKTAILVDTETGLQTDLVKSKDGYTFDATETGISSRFYVLLSPNISTIIDRTGNEEIDVLIKGKHISLSGLNGIAGVRMYDVVGKLMYQYEDIQNGQSFNVNIPGVYLMDISTETQKAKIKILIQDK